MRLVKIYKCPYCEKPYYSREEAEQCRNKHKVKIDEWFYCEICGAAWNGESAGTAEAIDMANACEAKHRKEGNAAEIAATTYFLTKGWIGKVNCIKGRKGAG